MLAPRSASATLGLVGLLVLALAAGCGSDGDDSSGAGPDGQNDGGASSSSGGSSGGGGDGGTPNVASFDVFTVPGTNKADDEAFAVGRAPDGKIVVAGTCSGLQSDENPWTASTTFCVARFGATGQVDPTFGTGGRLVLPTGWGARKLAVQSDGKIVLVGNAVGRLLPDGKPDTTFGGGDGLVPDDGAANLALQPDGKIVVTGARGGLARTTRYLPDGTSDATFGTAGVVETDVTAMNDFGTAVALQGDGKIVVAGVGALGAGQRRFIVMRYGADGKLDASFDGDGRVTSAFKGDDLAMDVALDDSGNIVVVGYGYPADSIVARYTSSGALDTAFNGTGYRLVSNDSSCQAVATQPGGTITCGGYGMARRYTSSGAPDATFGGGTGKISPNIRGEDMVLLDDGSFVLVGQSSTADLTAMKLTSAGSLDATFGTNGLASIDGGAAFDVATTVIGAADGSALLAGESALGAQLVMLGPSGALDPSFGTGGIASIADVFALKAVARQPSGKLIFTGFGTNSSFVVGRLEANGALDKSFGIFSNGITPLGVGTGRGVVTDGTSTWAVGGTALVKLDADGKLDTTFGKQGRVDGAISSAAGIARQPDGKLVVWSSAAGAKVLRFDPQTGAPDAAFGGASGVAGPAGFSAAHVAAQPDGKLLVTWIDELRTSLRLERRNADGTLDTTFAQSGAVTETLAPAAPKMAERPSSVRLDDGRIALVTSESDDFVVFLYDASGVRATSFGQGGRLSLRKSGTRLAVRAPVSAAGTKLFVAGTALVGTADADFALGRLPL